MKENITFKSFYLLSEKKDKNEQIKPAAIIIGDTVELIKAIPKLEEPTIGEVFTVNDVAENGDIKIDNYFGPEWHDKYFNSKYFKKVVK